jgi:transcriptional regulator with XRE-family HTH domain
VTGVVEPWNAQLQSLGEFIRRRRKLANLSLRQLAERTTLSNPYLSQIERGLHQPSVRVLKLISGALNVSAETLLTQAGLLDGTARDGTGLDGTGLDSTGLDSTGLDGTRLDGTALAATAPERSAVEAAITADNRLSAEHKVALLAVYRSMTQGQ